MGEVMANATDTEAIAAANFNLLSIRIFFWLKDFKSIPVFIFLEFDCFRSFNFQSTYQSHNALITSALQFF